MKKNIKIARSKAINLFGALLICGLLAVSMSSCGGDDWFKNFKKKKPKPADSTLVKDSTGTKDSTGGGGTGTKDSTGGGGTGRKDSTGTEDSTVWVKRNPMNSYSSKRD